jgi:hypothetical protein
MAALIAARHVDQICRLRGGIGFPSSATPVGVGGAVNAADGARDVVAIWSRAALKQL